MSIRKEGWNIFIVKKGLREKSEFAILNGIVNKQNAWLSFYVYSAGYIVRIRIHKKFNFDFVVSVK